VDKPLEHPPSHVDGKLGFTLTTSDPTRPIVIVCAESLHEKSLWITYLLRSLNSCIPVRPKLMAITPTWKSMKRFTRVKDEEEEEEEEDEIEEHTQDDRCTLPRGQLSPDSNDQSFRSLPETDTETPDCTSPTSCSSAHSIQTVLIASFVFDAGQLARMAVVCKTWNKCYGRKSNQRLWRWLVRRGVVSTRERWSFWTSCLNSVPVPSSAEFDLLLTKPSASVTKDIRRDVDRSFGVNPNKRVVVRRSVCFEEDEISEIQGTHSSKHHRTELDDIQEERDEMSATVNYTTSSLRPNPLSPQLPEWMSKPVSSLRNMTSLSPARPVSCPLTPPESTSLTSSPLRGMDAYHSLSDNGRGSKEGYNRHVGPVSFTAVSEEDKARKRRSLTRILHAFAARFEEVGYCQGLDRIVLHCMRAARCAVSSSSVSSQDVSVRDELDRLKEREVYAFIAGLFDRMQLTEMYSRHGVLGLRVRVAILGKLMERHCSELYEHITEQGLPIDAFGISWIQTLFLYIEAMPAMTIDKIWDIFIMESRWNIIYSAAVAIFKLSEQDLLTKNVDEIIYYFNHFPDPNVLHHRILLKTALNIDISSEYISLLEHDARESMIA